MYVCVLLIVGVGVCIGCVSDSWVYIKCIHCIWECNNCTYMGGECWFVVYCYCVHVVDGCVIHVLSGRVKKDLDIYFSYCMFAFSIR